MTIDSSVSFHDNDTIEIKVHKQRTNQMLNGV